MQGYIKASRLNHLETTLLLFLILYTPSAFRRVLRVGGIHMQVSFAQPHFRKKYLLGQHGDVPSAVGDDGVCEEFGWGCTDEPVAGDNKDGCFHHFFYNMHKSRKGKF